MEGLFEKIEPRYDLLDEKWNVQPAATRPSYKFVLFERKRGTESLRRERFVYEVPPVSKTNKMDLETPTSLLKVPIKQLLQSIEERKREAEKQREADLKKMTSSSSAMETSVARPQARRRLNEIYAPKSFMDLIGSDKTNRFALKWLKAWDHKVFKTVRSAHQPLPKNNSDSPGKQDLYLQNLKKRGKYIQDQQTLYENLSLNKEKDILEMSSKMLLLSGASGSGKSTLATVIAKKCGYNPMRVDLLSSDFTGERNQPRLTHLFHEEPARRQEHPRDHQRTDPPHPGRHRLVLLFEHQRTLRLTKAANRILDLLIKRAPTIKPKETSTGDSDKEDKEDKEDFEHTYHQQASRTTTNFPHDANHNKTSMASKRPIIFICDDSYSKGLKLIKNHCYHFKIEKNSATLIERLKEINRIEVRRHSTESESRQRNTHEHLQRLQQRHLWLSELPRPHLCPVQKQRQQKRHSVGLEELPDTRDFEQRLLRSNPSSLQQDTELCDVQSRRNVALK